MTIDVPMEVDVASVSRWLDTQKADMVLIDCREPHEADIVKIGGAVLMPMSQLPSRMSEVESLRGKHLVVHCHHGGRSLRVAQWLRSLGFEDAQSMAGGIDAWAIEIDSSLPRY